MINATPNEVGDDFLTNAVADTPKNFSVRFTDPDGDDTYSGTLQVPIDNDYRTEVTGEIKLTLNADPDDAATYLLGSATLEQ